MGVSWAESVVSGDGRLYGYGPVGPNRGIGRPGVKYSSVLDVSWPIDELHTVGLWSALAEAQSRAALVESGRLFGQIGSRRIEEEAGSGRILSHVGSGRSVDRAGAGRIRYHGGLVGAGRLRSAISAGSREATLSRVGDSSCVGACSYARDSASLTSVSFGKFVLSQLRASLSNL